MPAEVRKIDPTVDCVFKRLLGSEQHKALTLSFLNAVLELEGMKRLDEIYFVNTYLEKNHRDEKVPIVDILVRDLRGNIFQIEIQNQIDRYFESRAFYGWTKVNAGLLVEGQPYNELKHGISIWLLSECMFKPSQTKAASLRFRLHCPEEGLDLWPGSYLIVIQLPNLAETAKMNPEKAMWLRFFREAKDVDPNCPPSWLQHPTLQEALTVLQEFANDVDAYLGYLSLEKARREHWMRTTYLDQTVEELSSTKAELDETKAELGETKAELGKTNAALSETQARLCQSEVAQREAKAQLTAALKTIDDLARRMSALESERGI